MSAERKAYFSNFTFKGSCKGFLKYVVGNESLYACGHAALQMGLSYVKGQNVSISSIHTIMKKNDPLHYANKRCQNKFCASAFDIDMVANGKDNGGFGKELYPGALSPKNGLRKITSAKKLFKKIKDGIKHKTPMIVPSNWRSSYGHFYVVVGYEKSGNNQNELDDVTVYVRDPIVPIANPFSYYDKKVKLKTFYSHMIGNKVVFVKR